MQRSVKIKIEPLNKQPVALVSLLLEVTQGEFIKDVNNPTISEKISFVSRFLDMPFGKVSNMEIDSINLLVSKLMEIMESYVYNEPPMDLTIDGTTYELILEPKKQTAGWWHHLETIDADIQPEQFLGLAYIEKGMKYAQMDESSNIINPTADRGQKLISHFSVKTYLDLMGFFLKRFDLLIKISTVLREKKEAKKNRTKLIPSVGNER